MKNSNGICWMIVMLLAGATTVARSEEKPGTQEQAKQSPPAVVTRVYNVGDLIRQSPNYPFIGLNVPVIHVGEPFSAEGQQPSGGNTSIFSGQQGQENPVTPALVTLIKKTVAPDSWNYQDDAVAMQGDLLIVSQRQEQQAQIEQLLKDMRAESRPARMVTIRADWILLEPNQIDTIAKPLDEKTDPNLKVVDLAAAQKLNPKAHYRGQITCFDGQTVSVASIQGQSATTDIQPVVAQQSRAYNPLVKIPQAGAILQITPQISRDGATAVADVQSIVSDVRHLPTTQPINSEMAWEAIDKLNIQAQQLKTALRLPLGKPILVGGMTVAPDLTTGGHGQLYLVIELTASAGQQ